MTNHELTPQPQLFEFPTVHEEADFEYEQLKGHYRTNNTYKNDEQLKSEYVQLTDELVRQMTEGVNVPNPETGEYEKRRPDVVVWLDKSARPVSWLTKELWPVLAADKDGNIPEMPDFRFVNIDREQWVNMIDPQRGGMVNVDQIDQSIIRSLRSIFISPDKKTAGLTPELDEADTSLDGKVVLIVDEVQSSGNTLRFATNFFKRAFPKSAIERAYWMGGKHQERDRHGNIVAEGNADLPVWYDETKVTGRGVGNRDERISRQSPSQTQRLGAWFLSTSLKEEDPASTQLRRELKQLARDVVDHKVLFVPSMQRDIEDVVERAERINGMSFDEFRAANDSLKASTT